MYCILLFEVMYLASCNSQWIWQRHIGCSSNIVQNSEKMRYRPLQWLEKRSAKKAQAVHRGTILSMEKSKPTDTKEGETGEEWVQTYRDRERWDGWRAKSRTCSPFSLTSRGLFIKNSSWQSKQPIPHSTVMLYADCVTKELAVASLAEALGKVQTRERGLLRGRWWPVVPKLSFGQDGSTSPGNYGWVYIVLC
jgi:hypothetical protein